MSAAASLLLQAGLEPVPGYVLIKRLGGGGFGEVWKARGPGGIELALKFIKLEGNAGASEQRALEIIRAIRHPNLLTPSAAWTVDQVLVLAMELADGTLLDRLREAQQQGLPGIPRDELLDYMAETAKGLDHLNQRKHKLGDKEQVGVQHRDVKPQNILLVGGGIKVADFGLARVLEKSHSGHSGGMSVAYAAPEFFKNQTSEHSDQYCLAMTYCELRTGRLPFDADSVFAIIQLHLTAMPDLSMLGEAERPVVARALAKEPKERWPSCRAFVEALRAAQPAMKTDLREAPTPPPFEAPSRRVSQPGVVQGDTDPKNAGAKDTDPPVAGTKTQYAPPSNLPSPSGRTPALPPLSPLGRGDGGEGVEAPVIAARKRRKPAVVVTFIGLGTLALLGMWLGGLVGPNPTVDGPEQTASLQGKNDELERQRKQREKDAADQAEGERLRKKHEQEKRDAEAQHAREIAEAKKRLEDKEAELERERKQREKDQADKAESDRKLKKLEREKTDLEDTVKKLSEPAKTSETKRETSKSANPPRTQQSPYANSIGMKFIAIAPGEFQMGSNKSVDSNALKDEEPRHPVTIQPAFWMATYKTTQEEFEKVLERKPSYFSKTGGGSAKVGNEDTSRFPVERVSWYDAIEFCIKLSEQEQRRPCYRLSKIERDGDGSIKSGEVEYLSDGTGYRLPSEAEREYCARAGTRMALA